MRIVFFGTPEYVLPIVDKLHKNFHLKDAGGVVAVVTQAPKPAGRKKELKYSAVDKWAHKKNIPKFHSLENLEKKIEKADLGVVAAYGEIIPQSIINLFPKGILNIHYSQLPKYRGASPVQAAISSGDANIGVSIIKMDEKLDHGPVVSKFTEKITDTDTTDKLVERLTKRTSQVLIELLPSYLSGKTSIKPQDHKKASYSRLINKNDAFVDPKILNNAMDGKAKGEWEISFVSGLKLKPTPRILDRFIRAMSPWPTAWTEVSVSEDNKKRMKILKAHVDKTKLVLDQVQLAGKNPVSWKQFSEAYPQFVLN